MSAAIPFLDVGRRALDHLDRVLAERPDRNGFELSAALRCLGEFRDGIVHVRRSEPDHAATVVLGPLNGVISSVLAAQFPIGEIQWEEVVKARAWLSAVVGDRDHG